MSTPINIHTRDIANMTATATAPAPASTLEQGVAPTKGNFKKSVVMSWFASDKLKKEVAYRGVQAACGQVVGRIFQVESRQVKTTKDGVELNFTKKYAVGEFECTTYETGEFVETGIIYLPDYYLDSVKATLESMTGNGEVVIGMEIMLVPTGKNIPISYEIKHLRQRTMESPLERMKAEMAKAGLLRLPVYKPLLTIEGTAEAPAASGLPVNEEEAQQLLEQSLQADEATATPVAEAAAEDARARARSKAKAA